MNWLKIQFLTRNFRAQIFFHCVAYGFFVTMRRERTKKNQELFFLIKLELRNGKRRKKKDCMLYTKSRD